jgi:hypothetical protein
VHRGYPVLRAPRGFLATYSLPPDAIALGRRALDFTCAALANRVSRGATRVAESEVVQMALGEDAAAIDVATKLLRLDRRINSGRLSDDRVEQMLEERHRLIAIVEQTMCDTPAGILAQAKWALRQAVDCDAAFPSEDAIGAVIAGLSRLAAQF